MCWMQPRHWKRCCVKKTNKRENSSSHTLTPWRPNSCEEKSCRKEAEASYVWIALCCMSSSASSFGICKRFGFRWHFKCSLVGIAGHWLNNSVLPARIRCKQHLHGVYHGEIVMLTSDGVNEFLVEGRIMQYLITYVENCEFERVEGILPSDFTMMQEEEE